MKINHTQLDWLN